MTNKYEVVAADIGHAAFIAENMRKADVEEIWADSHRTPYNALVGGISVSEYPATGLVNGVPICMFGVGTSSAIDLHGRPWLLSTPDVEKHSRKFLRLNKSYINLIKEDYSLLYNWVDERNVAAVRWLEWLGFDILPAMPYGLENMPFHYFEMRA